LKSNLVFFLGLFCALGISWAAIVLGSNAQLGSLAPYFDDNQGTAFPQWMTGVAARGQLVYRDLGCAACHTQQVRRPDFGSDKDRGWGDRQSVARDYIYEPYPQLGMSRIGPDLANLGDRKPSAPDEEDLLNLLYSGSGGMPSYRFLFEEHHVGSGAQLSDRALKLTGALAPKAGWEIVPTQRAEALVGFLVNLKTTYDYPEAVPFVPPKPEGAEAPKAAAAPAAPPPGGAPAPAAPGAAASTPSPTGSVTPTPGAAAAPAAGAPAPGAANAAAPSPSPTGAAAPANAAAPSPSPTGSATPSSGASATPTPGAAAAPAAGGAPAPAAANAAGPSPSPTGAATPASAAAPSPSPTGSATPASGAAAAPAAGGAPAPAAASAAAPTPSPTGAATPASGSPAAPAAGGAAAPAHAGGSQ